MIESSTKHNNHLTDVMTHEGVFSDQEVDKILELASDLSSKRGNTQDLEDKSTRDSHISWIPMEQNASWLYDKLSKIAAATNKFFRFDIDSISSIQVASYSNGGNYGWHVDIGAGDESMRKVSISVQLSDSDEYEGGDLEFFSHKMKATRTKGSVIIFPSYIVHRVNPVTSGTRISLVTWVMGAPYK